MRCLRRPRSSRIPPKASPPRAFLLLGILLLAVHPAAASERVLPAAIDVSGGIFVPFDGQDRNAFGSGSVVNLGFSSSISDRGNWVVVETGLVHGSGTEFASDGTFELDRTSSYWLYPLTVGFRFNTVIKGEERPVRLYMGFGIRTLFSRYRGPFGGATSATTMGVYVELRPEFSLSRRTSLFVRERISTNYGTNYGGRTTNLDYAGGTLDFGLCRRLDLWHADGEGSEP